jgi:hypothetical protein
MVAISLLLFALTGAKGSADILAFTWISVVVLSGVAAASYRGRRRAFWSGFCATLLLASTRQVFGFYGAKLDWTRQLSMQLVSRWQGDTSGHGQQVSNFNTALILLTFLVAATLIGFLSVVVFDCCQESETD